jgi:endonuclease YncB( thermonuclease family)
MTIQAKKQNPWLVGVLIVGAIALWVVDQRKLKLSHPPASPTSSQQHHSAPPPSPTAAGKAALQGGYEVYRSCTLVAEKNNDGDSFLVRLPDGREEIMRLYFVDCPESAFKSYRGGETNHQRIDEQARDFNVTPQRAVATGQLAKHFTLDLLEKQPFTIYTRWDSPFHDQRYHAFVEVQFEGKTAWLDELLMERGLARLKTKPADLPDGTPASKHRQDLEAAKHRAIQAHAGAWQN